MKQQHNGELAATIPSKVRRGLKAVSLRGRIYLLFFRRNMVYLSEYQKAMKKLYSSTNMTSFRIPYSGPLPTYDRPTLGS